MRCTLPCRTDRLPPAPCCPLPVLVAPICLQVMRIKFAWQRYLKQMAIAAMAVRPWLQRLQGLTAASATAAPGIVAPALSQAARQHMQVCCTAVMGWPPACLPFGLPRQVAGQVAMLVADRLLHHAACPAC